MSPGPDHKTLLERTIDLALEGLQQGGGPFGALVAQTGRVIGEGHNQVTSDHDPTAHAEVLAIRRACVTLGDHRLAGCVLYTSCEPCPMCLSAAHWARLDHVYYAASRHDAADAGFDDRVLYEQLASSEPPSSPSHERIELSRATLPFAKWAEDSNKIPY